MKYEPKAYKKKKKKIRGGGPTISEETKQNIWT
jgi:hypothetical protein